MTHGPKKMKRKTGRLLKNKITNQYRIWKGTKLMKMAQTVNLGAIFRRRNQKAKIQTWDSWD